ncbi:MAG: hypothetical protein NC121_01730 [Blautia sp.]|nr:hypothetical protein [Blautia sp.]
MSRVFFYFQIHGFLILTVLYKYVILFITYREKEHNYSVFTWAVRSLVPLCIQRQFLTYFEHTVQENACNEDLMELHKMVLRVRVDEEVELAYMKIFEREEMIREQGWLDGLAQGGTRRLTQQIMKKIEKGKSLETTAEELEEDAASISGLYQLIADNPDKTAEDILQMKFESERQGE